jgi:Flp pilus assembly protein TadB
MILGGIAGVVTGLVGNVFTAWNNRKAEKSKQEHEIKLIEANTSAMIMESEANIRITETNIAGNKDVFKESYMEKLFSSKVGSWFGTIIAVLFGIADWIKAVTRPLITVFLVGLVAWMVVSGMGELVAMVDLVVYLATTAVVWWFGYRNESKFQKLRDNK